MAVGDVKIGITMYSFDEEGVLTGEKTDIDPEKPMLALTFDDGPGERTMDLLNALEEYKAHATFFMCGTSLSRTDIDVDAILKKMDAIGCDTSNHTMTHPKLDTLTAEQVVQDKTADAEAQDGDILAGILQHTQRPFFGVAVLHRHQGKRQRRNHQPADAAHRGVQLVGRDVGAFQRTGRHGAEDEHRHIVPAGIVAGVEGIERAVEDGHQRKHCLLYTSDAADE